MTLLERELLKTLQELDLAVQSMRPGSQKNLGQETAGGPESALPKPDLLGLFARIDELARQLPKGTAPDLQHYLAKKSYEKARLWLEGRDAENQAGSCRH